jgi:hypothetical protein
VVRSVSRRSRKEIRVQNTALCDGNNSAVSDLFGVSSMSFHCTATSCYAWPVVPNPRTVSAVLLIIIEDYFGIEN